MEKTGKSTRLPLVPEHRSVAPLNDYTSVNPFICQISEVDASSFNSRIRDISVVSVPNAEDLLAVVTSSGIAAVCVPSLCLHVFF